MSMQKIIERTNTPRLVVLVGILVTVILAACCSGCASMEQFTDDHPQVVPVASVVILTVGGIALAKGIAKSGGVQVHPCNPSPCATAGAR